MQGRGGGEAQRDGSGVTLRGARIRGDLLQVVCWGHTHGSAREPSLSWESP